METLKTPLDIVCDSLVETAQEVEKDNRTEKVEDECPKHGMQQFLVMFFNGHEFRRFCPECGREAEEQEEKRKEEEEAIRKESDRKCRIKEANIEPAFEYVTLGNFTAKTEEQSHNVEKMRALVNGEIKKIVMTGKNGTGKTHLACAAIHALGGKIMTMYEISTSIRATYGPCAQYDELYLVDSYSRLPLFVIDEIGRTKGSDTEANWLSYIIDKRHVRGLPTILISNKHTRKTCPNNGCADCLENYIGEDIMSRLCEDGILLKFTGDDYRKRR
jgi:DNA replication protein DnaC